MNPRVLILALLLGLLMWLILLWAVNDSGNVHAEPAATSSTTRPTPPTTTTVAPVAAVNTTAETLPRSHTTAPTGPAPVVATGAARSISSTAYCESGRMASGEYAYEGAVSSKVLPRGSRWRVLTGGFAGRVFTVKDTGALAYFDIALPGRCSEAVAYGRQTIQIEAA